MTTNHVLKARKTQRWKHDKCIIWKLATYLHNCTFAYRNIICIILDIATVICSSMAAVKMLNKIFPSSCPNIKKKYENKTELRFYIPLGSRHKIGHFGDDRLVGWSFNVPFQHKYGYERSGVESYPLTQWRKASDIVTSTPAAFLFSSHRKRERDWEAHLNYYASAHNTAIQLLHCKTKLNQIQQNTRINLNHVTKEYR